MRPKTFSVVKEGIAAAKPAATEAVASAQIVDRVLAAANSGRDGEAAARRAAMMSLGKKSILFRFGNAPSEREGIVSDVGEILKGDGKQFPINLVDVIAGTALHELTFDRCVTCLGRGLVPDHSVEAMVGRQPMKTCPTCIGQKRRRFSEDARVNVLARHIAAEARINHESDDEYNDFVTFTATELRSSRRIREVLRAVDFAKSILLDAERAAVEGAAIQSERA